MSLSISHEDPKTCDPALEQLLKHMGTDPKAFSKNKSKKIVEKIKIMIFLWKIVGL